MRRVLPFGVLLAIGSVSSVASAQTMAAVPITSPPSTAENVITLRDGAILRGRIVDLRPGQYVIVVTAGGNRTVAWSDIARADGPSFPGGYLAEPDPDAAPVAPADYRHPGAGRVPLAIESAGVPLEISESFAAENEGDGFTSQTIGGTLCTTPCTLYVAPTAFALRSRARGIRANRVTVTVPAEGLRLRLRASSSTRFYGGIGAIAGGSAFAAVGLALTTYAAFVPSVSRIPGTPYRGPVAAPFYAAGGIFLGLGVAALVTGIVLAVGAPSGIASSSPFANPRGPQLSFGASPDAVSAAMTLHF